jgi:ribosomal subunit interface protein
VVRSQEVEALIMTGSLQVPLQIILRNMRHSEALEAHIRQKSAKLEEIHPRIVSCRVTVEQTGKHQQQGHDFRAGIEVRLPGRQPLVVNREHDEDPYIALREAFDTMTRQLNEIMREQKASMRAHESPLQG